MRQSPFVKMELTEEVREGMRISLSFLPTKLSNDPVCDFCGGNDPIIVYRAKRMTIGLQIHCWRWCACQACEGIVDAENWPALRDRVRERLKKLLPNGMVTNRILDQVIDNSIQTFRDDVFRVRASR